ncbi:LysR family transcriptional regulator [Roseibium sp.]|uniref:LysR family transcriptional regulator n=1 Tax=Roseibium sp. TaxID=1936156 RepID=UPI003A981755
MNWAAIGFDWNQARAFLATAELGSLSAAAKALNLTQPTVGRQVAALEESLGLVLVERAGRSIVITEAGRELLMPLREMANAALAAGLAASGKSDAAEGLVSISASDVMAAYVLPEIIADLRATAPGIEIEVVASNSLSDISRREADIAIRHVRPSQPELVARLIREARVHIYAAESLLERLGCPERLEDLSGEAFVGFGDRDEMVGHLNRLGLNLTAGNIKVNSASGVVAWQMVREGLGLCVMEEEIARRTPGIAQVLPDMPPTTIPIWLVTHRELHTSRRIRLVFDTLASALAKTRAEP